MGFSEVPLDGMGFSEVGTSSPTNTPPCARRRHAERCPPRSVRAHADDDTHASTHLAQIEDGLLFLSVEQVELLRSTSITSSTGCGEIGGVGAKVMAGVRSALAGVTVR